MNILIIDDDHKLCKMLKLFFEQRHYNTTTVHSGNIAIECLKTQHDEFDLIILDIYMPELCGIETCKKIRAFSEIPILMLTSCTEEVQTVLSLEIGADDYMTKPFKATVLLARIKAILRRSHYQPKSLSDGNVRYLSGTCCLNIGSQSLHDGQGKMIPITTGVYRLLKYLMERPNQVISRDTLMEGTQNRPLEYYDRSIDVQIARLRKILKKMNTKNAIKTIHGSGYMWIIPVTRQ